MDRAGLYQWGPDLPNDFIDARLTSRRFWILLMMAVKDKARLKRMIAIKNSMSTPGRQWQR